MSVRKVTPEEAESWERPRRIIETLLWFVGALLLAAVIPDIGSAINMISGLAAMFIFVFPGECKFLHKAYYFSEISKLRQSFKTQLK